MDIFAGPDGLAAHPRVLAIGTFDGVHVGHRAVIGRAVELGRLRGLTSAVVTFDRHPLSVVAPARAPRLLTPLPEKVRLIKELAPDELVLLHFDVEMAALQPAAFCGRLLADALKARIVVVGENFNFGVGGGGDVAALRACGDVHGFETIALSLVTERGGPISSTRIRQLLHAGELEEVREILGRPPSAVGNVEHGVHRGRTLGVPTANLDVETGAIFPGRGVYAARALVDRRWYRAAVNIGHNPTFRRRDEETAHVTMEAFLLDFDADIYGRGIRVDFLHKIRDERRFEGADALVAQIRRDIAVTASLDDEAFREVGLERAPVP
jgi:riboflavin kinase / FMN adenylyltransferase